MYQDIESQRDRYKAHVSSLIKELQGKEDQSRVVNHRADEGDEVDTRTEGRTTSAGNNQVAANRKRKNGKLFN